MTTTDQISETMVSKLGTNKGVPRSRVWIEGKRLRAAGFHAKQTQYDKLFTHADVGNEPALILSAKPSGALRVSGKGDHPIVDITGKQVADHFAGFINVTVTYLPDEIVIIGNDVA